MMQGDLFNPQCETRNAQPDNKPVDCLGLTFPNDEERRKYFLKKLREGLEELHAKLGGVPFTTVEDAMKRMKSVEKWPLPACAWPCLYRRVLMPAIIHGVTVPTWLYASGRPPDRHARLLSGSRWR